MSLEQCQTSNYLKENLEFGTKTDHATQRLKMGHICAKYKRIQSNMKKILGRTHNPSFQSTRKKNQISGEKNLGYKKSGKDLMMGQICAT